MRTSVVPSRENKYAWTYYAATGTGLYRTDDTGRFWTRLDEGRDRSYLREAFVHDGTLYAAATAARHRPGVGRTAPTRSFSNPMTAA